MMGLGIGLWSNNVVAAAVGGGFGPELVVDGAFASGANWTAGTGWSVTGGQGVASGTTDFLWQNNSIVSGHTYQVVFTLSGWSAGLVLAYIGDSVTFGTARGANGTYTENITATSSGSLGFQGASAFAGIVDNFSVKEVL